MFSRDTFLIYPLSISLITFSLFSADKPNFDVLSMQCNGIYYTEIPDGGGSTSINTQPPVSFTPVKMDIHPHIPQQPSTSGGSSLLGSVVSLAASLFKPSPVEPIGIDTSTPADYSHPQTVEDWQNHYREKTLEELKTTVAWQDPVLKSAQQDVSHARGGFAKSRATQSLKGWQNSVQALNNEIARRTAPVKQPVQQSIQSGLQDAKNKLSRAEQLYDEAQAKGAPASLDYVKGMQRFVNLMEDRQAELTNQTIIHTVSTALVMTSQTAPTTSTPCIAQPIAAPTIRTFYLEQVE